MEESDVVVVSAPLTTDTQGMIGAEQLRALGRDGVLVNVGRGPLVAERALLRRALRGWDTGRRDRRLVPLSGT